MSDLCYLCASEGATKPIALKDTFTDHSNALAPDSPVWCDRCEYFVNLRGWYWNAAKEHPKGCQCRGPHVGMWVVLFGRVPSWLISERETLPIVGAIETHWPNEPIETKQSQACALPVLSSLPTRLDMRRWLTNPPEPPFRIIIAESGQKHLLPWAREAHSRDSFPVMFEKHHLIIERESFTELLTTFERLLEMGFAKGEILSGDYRSDRLMKAGLLGERLELESRIENVRGMRLLELVSHVAQYAEKSNDRG